MVVRVFWFLISYLNLFLPLEVFLPMLPLPVTRDVPYLFPQLADLPLPSACGLFGRSPLKEGNPYLSVARQLSLAGILHLAASKA